MKRISRIKILTYSLTPLLLLLGIAECIAWGIDANQHYRERFLRSLSLLEPVNSPVSAKLPPKKGDHKISVRAPDTDTQKEYIIGGKIIPEATDNSNLEYISPEDVKKTNSKKIFIVGGSVAFGFPYPYHKTFASLLNESLPKNQYKVYNAAQTGATSGDVFPVAKNIIDHYSPDILILLTGNNEWIHWVAAPQPWISPQYIKTIKFLSHSRLLSIIFFNRMKYLAKNQELLRKKSNLSFKIHSELKGFYYALANPYEKFSSFNAKEWLNAKNDFIENFEKNILYLVKYAHTKGVRPIIVTIPINYKLSICWKHPQPESFNPLHKKTVRENIKEIVHLIEAKQYNSALNIIEATLKLDPFVPILYYFRGYILEKKSNFEQARMAYASARENMVGNLGSILTINNTIRDISLKTGATLVDLEKIFIQEEKRLGGNFNEHLIDDDCHPNPRGQQLMAQSLRKAVTNSSWDIK